MKKLVYSLAVLFTVALVSCGGNEKKDADTVNADSQNVEANVEDTNKTEDTAAQLDEAANAETNPEVKTDSSAN